MRRTFLFLILIAIVAIACGRHSEKPSGYQDKTAPPPKPPTSATTALDVGATMPSYSAASLDGTPFDLARERGNVVLLNLWATWCAPCRIEIPELQKLHNDLSARGFKVIGVSVDEEEDPKVVREFVAEQKISYPIVHDPEGKLAVLFEAFTLPTSVLVDRKGKIVWKHIGIVRASDEEMLKALNAAL